MIIFYKVTLNSVTAINLKQCPHVPKGEKRSVHGALLLLQKNVGSSSLFVNKRKKCAVPSKNFLLYQNGASESSLKKEVFAM